MQGKQRPWGQKHPHLHTQVRVHTEEFKSRLHFWRFNRKARQHQKSQDLCHTYLPAGAGCCTGCCLPLCCTCRFICICCWSSWLRPVGKSVGGSLHTLLLRFLAKELIETFSKAPETGAQGRGSLGDTGPGFPASACVSCLKGCWLRRRDAAAGPSRRWVV
eukprot:scaffold15634_cov14-Tisochrysis_lutea.AAC.1